MLSSVLRSQRAVQVNVEIMRAFVKRRELLATHKDLARKLEVLERKYGAQFTVVFDAIPAADDAAGRKEKADRVRRMTTMVLRGDETIAAYGGHSFRTSSRRRIIFSSTQ